MEAFGAAAPLTVLWNVHSGWEAGDAAAEKVRRVLAEVDPNLRFERIHEGRQILPKAHKAVRSGAATLVAAGGDGTLNAVASALVQTKVRMGVIPAGTLNHFARDLGLSIDPVTAAEELRQGREITVDVGMVNGRIFINNSVLGLYPVYRAERESLESGWLGSSAVGRFFAVLGGLLRVFWRLPHLRLRLVTQSGTHDRSSPFVLIANNEHELEKGRIGRRTTMSEGHLWVYVMRRCSRWAMLRYFLRYIFGRFSKHEVFEEFEAQQIRIETRRKQIRVGLDGEIVRMRSPLEYCSMSRALRVIAPENSPLVK